MHYGWFLSASFPHWHALVRSKSPYCLCLLGGGIAWCGAVMDGVEENVGGPCGAAIVMRIYVRAAKHWREPLHLHVPCKYY